MASSPWLSSVAVPVSRFGPLVVFPRPAVWPATRMASKKRAGEAAEGQPQAKKPVGAPAAASGAPPLAQAPVAAASGALPLAQAPVPPPLCIAKLLETESASLQKKKDELAEWVRAAKTYVDHALHMFLQERKSELSFALPPKCSMIPPLAISNNAAPGANLSAFREVINYDNMMASLSRTKQYEAAGTVWMLDPISSDIDDVSVIQLEGAIGIWSAGALRLSSTRAPSQRLSFDAPLPVKVVDANKVAQRVEAGKPGVCVAEPLLMLAGRAVVIAWYSAMSQALQQSNRNLAWHLFNAALSVPIRMRLLPDGDASHLAALTFSETLFASAAAGGADSFWRFAEKACRLTGVATSFAKQESAVKLEVVIKNYGLTFRSKAIGHAGATALKAVQPFVMDDACCSAFALAEAYCPELRDPTLLMRICYACSGRNAVCDAKAGEYFVFIMNCLRVARLTGDIPKDEKISVRRTIGRKAKKTPGTLWALFKKKELVDFIFHEAGLHIDKDTQDSMAIFKTPLGIVQKFAASGADGLAASYRTSESGSSPDGMRALFARPVAEHRDGASPKAKAMIDVAWLVWNGDCDGDIADLAAQEMMQHGSVGFSWHTWLSETSQQLGTAYGAFVAAFTTRPTPAAPPEEDMSVGLSGVTTLGDAQKEELRNLQELLKQLRRRTVRFVALPHVSGASGAEFSQAQLQSAWEKISLGHRFGKKKKDHVRAIVASAELFPPNLVKQGAKARLIDPMACDDDKWKRLIEFVCSKRGKDDVLILFDGRGRANRRAIEFQEQKLVASGAHTLVECWCVYSQPSRQEDPRAVARAHSHTLNNKETVFFSLPAGVPRRVVHRSEFNSCGETSSAATTYTGISMRRFSELPRMSCDTKASILEAAAPGPEAERLKGDIHEKGHPLSYNEVKPISFWQTIMEHHTVTHIVDFTPGSGALAVAASGAVEYEGIAANEAHRDWLDSVVDRCVMYKAGHETGYAEQLGGDAEFVEKASKYFGGTMMEARRLLMPAGGDGDEGDDDEDDGGSDLD